MITEKNDSKSLTKDISCECNFDGRKSNSNEIWDNNKSRCKCNKRYIFGILLHVAAKMVNI